MKYITTHRINHTNVKQYKVLNIFLNVSFSYYLFRELLGEVHTKLLEISLLNI